MFVMLPFLVFHAMCFGNVCEVDLLLHMDRKMQKNPNINMSWTESTHIDIQVLPAKAVTILI